VSGLEVQAIPERRVVGFQQARRERQSLYRDYYVWTKNRRMHMKDDFPGQGKKHVKLGRRSGVLLLPALLPPSARLKHGQPVRHEIEKIMGSGFGWVHVASEKSAAAANRGALTTLGHQVTIGKHQGVQKWK
jgi:hypothetical protein